MDKLRLRQEHSMLNALKKGRKISAQLEKEEGMYKSHVSRTIKELMDRGLIKCINPADRNFRFYELTTEGKKALVKANNLNQLIKK